MALRKYNPTTPSQRQLVLIDRSDLYKGRPEKSLTEGITSSGGRNNLGRITMRRRGGGAKKLYRIVDFKRRKHDIEAKVERINPATDAGTRSIKLYLSVDNSDGALRGGMFAQGELVLDKTAPAPTVPTSAIRSDAGVTYVLVVDNGKLVRRTVTLGLKTDDNSYVEVVDGLSVGTQVLSAKIDTLLPGAEITIAKAAEPGAATAPAGVQK